MVHRYPRAPDSKVLLDILARQHEDPSIESLMAPSDLSDAQHTANWEAVVHHIDNIDANGLHGHATFLARLV